MVVELMSSIFNSMCESIVAFQLQLYNMFLQIQQERGDLNE